MNKDKIKGFIIGVILTVVMSGVITAFAATIDVEIGGIRIFWDGVEKILTDVNGETVEPMIYNGTTYVPVRAMSELMGKSVEWDEATTTVYVGGRPEGVSVATVNGEEITDIDVNYYIYAQAAAYAQNTGMTFDEIASFDWEQQVGGKKLSDTIKEKAVKDAVNEVLIIQKGAENGIVLSEEEEAQIDSQINGIKSTYGEDGFTLRARTMGISSPNQYAKMYRKVMATQKVQADISANAAAYYPEDVSVLNHYIQPDGATVKHILISADETNKAEKRRVAENVLKRIQSGEDFDALVAQFNEDPGATEEGYTFGPGEMVEEFEKASFALSIGAVSGIVETEYGFHIIKRIPGIYELQAYWQAEAADGINITADMVNALDVKAVMKDVVSANSELENQ